MKTLFTLILALMICDAGQAQEKDIETESVKLDNFISFIVDEYPTQRDSATTKNITILIETYADRFNPEDRILLKQAFKLLSKRLSEQDHISIVFHSHLNGIALDGVEASNIKSLLHVMENPKSYVQISNSDGVEIAYEFTETNFIQSADNSVVMLRMPNRKSSTLSSGLKADVAIAPKKNNAVVLTAIALLPEIIALIKD